MIRQIGLGEGEALIPNDNQLFRGFDFLRDYFAFPRRFLGFDLAELDAVASRLDAKTIDIVFAFDDVNPQLAAAVRKEMFALYTAPGANLFEKRLDRIPVKSNQFEFPVIPDRSPHARFRDQSRRSGVRPRRRARRKSLPFEPLYSARAAPQRRPASPTPSAACPGGAPPTKGNSGQFPITSEPMSFCRSANARTRTRLLRVAELSVEALCTNRHLAAHLPVGESGADFRFLDDAELELTLRRRSDQAARAARSPRSRDED